MFQKTTTEQPTATNAVEVNAEGKAQANPGIEGAIESTQVELDTVGNRYNGPEIAKDSRESTSNMRQEPQLSGYVRIIKPETLLIKSQEHARARNNRNLALINTINDQNESIYVDPTELLDRVDNQNSTCKPSWRHHALKSRNEATRQGYGGGSNES